VPPAVPGIVFLSGGQSPEQATEHLSVMNRMGPCPWELSFSFGRALQEYSLKAWQGEPSNVPQAQKVFAGRSRLNGLARFGKYSREMEHVG
jgi:fructose-bisphosphate aldolase class I